LRALEVAKGRTTVVASFGLSSSLKRKKLLEVKRRRRSKERTVGKKD
jgi:hypothetical protein